MEICTEREIMGIRRSPEPTEWTVSFCKRQRKLTHEYTSTGGDSHYNAPLRDELHNELTTYATLSRAATHSHKASAQCRLIGPMQPLQSILLHQETTAHDVRNTTTYIRGVSGHCRGAMILR